MKFFESVFKKVQKSVAAIRRDNDVYVCCIDSSENVLLDKSALAYNAKKGNNDIENAFYAAISILGQYHSAGEQRARTDVFLRLARSLNYFPFAAQDGVIYISTLSDKSRNIESDFLYIDTLFQNIFGTGIRFCKANSDDWHGIIEQHIENAHNFYVETHGVWTEEFMAEMGDDISRDSFASFLQQRITASIFDDSTICWPVLPPNKTIAWRRDRERGKYCFPSLVGCDQELLQKIFYKYIFVYEQYAIPGSVEVQPGDTVIDAGAFIGDTACYFSRKVGKYGRVFSFEVAPESISFFEENMRINKCDNVRVVPCGLSDASGTLYLSLNAFDSSSNSVDKAIHSSDSQAITAKMITLDEYCHENKLSVQFIKADIEGSEMQMLRGAVNTITTHAPACAICLYHRQNDYWEIPRYLKALCPEYTFWFRSEAEPVLFAKRTR